DLVTGVQTCALPIFDPVLGAGDGRVRLGRYLAQSRRPSRIHALRGRGLARLRRLLQLLARGAGAAVRDRPESCARRPRTEPALAEPVSHGDPPPAPLLGVPGQDAPPRPRLRRPAPPPPAACSPPAASEPAA